MPAAEFDIEIEEGADLDYDFTYLDEDGNAVDVTNYGATILLAKDDESPPFFKGTAQGGDIQVGGTDGSIILQVDSSNFDNMDIRKGVWQLFIYPTIGDPTDRPKRFMEGEFVYKPSPLNR